MKNRLTMVLICVIVILAGSIVYDKTKAAGNDPGSIADPLVTKSYVDTLNLQLLEQVEALISSTPTKGTTGQGTTAPNNMTDIYNYIDTKLAGIVVNGVDTSTGFKVIQVTIGQKVICEASTEMIVRSGETQAIGNATGDGISDVTGGKDIKNNELIINNHLLIVPKSDGRGLVANNSCFIMIKGNYRIQ